MIGIVDYGMGNLQSVANALRFLNKPVRISSDPKELLGSEKLILPGVGAFGDAVAELDKRDLRQVVLSFIQTGKPFLGICLGLQLLLESSEESPGAKGLGVFEGCNLRFPSPGSDSPERLKVPQIGWNRLLFTKPECPLFHQLKQDTFFYFVHAFFAQTSAQNVAGVTEYGVHFPSVLWRENIFATQFHPEKSQKAGLTMLANFAEIKA